jgi:hypothetical protein
MPYIENWGYWPDYGQELNLGPPDTGVRNWDYWLGHYQQIISDRESTIMPYIDNFGFWPE